MSKQSKTRNNKNHRRRQQSRKNYYAIARGYKTGIFKTWGECKSLTNHYPHPVFQGFQTKEAAEHYLAGYTVSQVNNRRQQQSKSSHKSKHSVSRSPYQIVKEPGKYDILVYIASQKKHGISQWAYAVVDDVQFKQRKVLTESGTDQHNTNLGVQWLGIIDFLKRYSIYKKSEITLGLDNDYLYKSFAYNWIGKWERNGYHLKGGRDIKYKAEIKQVVKLLKSYQHIKVMRVDSIKSKLGLTYALNRIVKNNS